MSTIPKNKHEQILKDAKYIKSQLDYNIVDFKAVSNFVDFILDDKPLTTVQLQEMFKQYLEKEFPNDKTYQHFWSYDEGLSSDELEEILKLANDKKADSFEHATTWYLCENRFDIEYDDIEPYIKDFIAENAEIKDQIQQVTDEECGYDFLIETFHEIITYDYNAVHLLSNSYPNDLTIYLGSNWDNDYNILQREFVLAFEDDDFETSDSNTPLDWLIQSQGYTRADLKSEEKRKTSPFLTSVYEELFDYVTDLNGCQLVAIPSSDDFEAILNLSRKKNVVIGKGTLFGFFNTIHGSASGLSIELEKDILVDENTPLYKIEMDYHNDLGHYSPDAVCGLAKSQRGDDLLIVSK